MTSHFWFRGLARTTAILIVLVTSLVVCQSVAIAGIIQPPGYTFWPRHQIYAWPHSIVGGSPVVVWNGSVYAAIPRPGYPSKGTEILRINIARRKHVATSFLASIVPYEGAFAVADGWLWVLGVSKDEIIVYRLRTSNLTVSKEISFPGTWSTGALAAAGDLVWIAAGRSLVEMTTTGHVIVRVTLPPPGLTSLTVNQKSGRLYDVFNDPKGGAIQERNAMDFAVLAAAPTPSAIRTWALTADPDGVWASVVGGMSALLVRYSEKTLSLQIIGKEGQLTGTNALITVDTGTTLWWIDSEVVQCLNPTTGNTISRTSVFTADGRVCCSFG